MPRHHIFSGSARWGEAKIWGVAQAVELAHDKVSHYRPKVHAHMPALAAEAASMHATSSGEQRLQSPCCQSTFHRRRPRRSKMLACHRPAQHHPANASHRSLVRGAIGPPARPGRRLETAAKRAHPKPMHRPTAHRGLSAWHVPREGSIFAVWNACAVSIPKSWW